jgi:hypothetical protein
MGVAAVLVLAPVIGNTGTRSAQAVSSFKRHHPCPATGARSGSCPGYVVDHIEPLCAGGSDHPANMQWQTVADAKVKDVTERMQCRGMRKGTRH